MKKSSETSDHRRTLLIIDDDRLFCDAAGAALESFGVNIKTAHTVADGLKICTTHPVDLALLDQKLPDGDGIEIFSNILASNEGVKIIFITAFPSFENAVQAIKVGAHDYLSKPFEMGELRLAVGQALRTLDLEHLEQVQHYQLKKESNRTILVGAEKGLRQVRQMVELAAGNRAPVLITGETGTGKTLVAKSIHYRSRTADKAFISINCAAIPENLIEAELFGHEKGAFTGADQAAKGLFEMADGGTLFLDEIGEMPIQLQSKLLGVLDDQQIRRLGGQAFKPVDVRIIAATNADLAEAVLQKRFREDLYYRLGVLHIHVPPLRERLDDLADLCRHFIANIAPDRKIEIDIDELPAMQAYTWPGNVRELRNIIERAILLRKGPRIRPSLLLGQNGRMPEQIQPVSQSDPIATLDAMERTHIQKALNHFEGNQTHADRALGISRSTLIRKIKLLNISG